MRYLHFVLEKAISRETEEIVFNGKLKLGTNTTATTTTTTT